MRANRRSLIRNASTDELEVLLSLYQLCLANGHVPGKDHGLSRLLAHNAGFYGLALALVSNLTRTRSLALQVTSIPSISLSPSLLLLPFVSQHGVVVLPTRRLLCPSLGGRPTYNVTSKNAFFDLLAVLSPWIHLFFFFIPFFFVFFLADDGTLQNAWRPLACVRGIDHAALKYGRIGKMKLSRTTISCIDTQNDHLSLFLSRFSFLTIQ